MEPRMRTLIAMVKEELELQFAAYEWSRQEVARLEIALAEMQTTHSIHNLKMGAMLCVLATYGVESPLERNAEVVLVRKPTGRPSGEESG